MHPRLAILLLLASATVSSAQTPATVVSDVGPGAAATATASHLSVEVHGGWAGFLDDATVDHVVLGGAVRWRPVPRLTIGPEVTWMAGPDTDRDLFVVGAVTWDLRSPGAVGSVVPYLVAAGGLMAHASGYGRGTWGSEGAVSGGAGVRIPLGRRGYVAPDVRVGWEPHLRITVAGGWAF